MKTQNYRTFSKAGLITAFISNSLVILGVIAFGWSAEIIIYTFLIELAVTAIFSIVYMIFARKLYDPYFAMLNPYWVVNYKTKAKFLISAIPSILILSIVVSVFTITITWPFAGTEVISHFNEIIYFGIIMLVSNLVSFIIFVSKFEYKNAYTSFVFRTFLTRKLLPLFIGVFLLSILFDIISTFVLVLIVLKIGNDLLTYYNENKLLGED